MGCGSSTTAQPKSKEQTVKALAKCWDPNTVKDTEAKLIEKYGKQADFTRVYENAAEAAAVLKPFAHKVCKKMGWTEKDKAKVKAIVKELFRDPVAELVMQITHISSFDELFGRAADPINTVIDSRENLEEGRGNLLACCEFAAEVSTIEGALKAIKAELKSVSVGIEVRSNGAIWLTVNSSGPITQAINAFNTLCENVVKIIENCPKLIEQLEELANTAKDFPDRAQEEATSAGLSPMQIPAAVKNTAANCKALSQLPNVVKDFMKECQATFEDLKKAKDILGSIGASK